MSERSWYDDLISKYPVATSASNMEMVLQYQAGDVSVLGELIGRNLRMVSRHASKYLGNDPESLQDLLQLGAMGIVEAANRFDVTLGYQFITYANSYIIREMRNYHYDCGLVHIPKDARARINLVHNVIVALKIRPTLENYDLIKAEALRIGGGRATRMIPDDLNKYSHQARVYQHADLVSDYDDGRLDGDAVSSFVSGESSMIVEDEHQAQEDRQLTEELMADLDDRSKYIVKRLYGMAELETEGEWNLGKIGKELGISRERVRQINLNSLRMMGARARLLGIRAEDVIHG